MRVCPKCGAEFGDTDIRSMCGPCLVALVPKASPPAASCMDAPGPVTLGGPTSGPSMTLPTIELPTIAVPDLPPPPVPAMPEVAPRAAVDVLPEVPARAPMPEPPPVVDVLPEVPPPRQPDPPQYEPGPIAPPFTPPMTPDEPQPYIVPPPSPMPQPAPVPQRPQPMPQPMPRREPEPEPAQPSARTSRRMNQTDMASARAAASGFSVAGGVLAFIALIVLIGGARDFGCGHFLLVGGLGVAAVLLIRKAIYRSAIAHARITPAGGITLGGQAPLTVSVGVLRDITITEADLKLVCTERVVSSDGKTTYRNVLHTRGLPLRLAGGWTGGQELNLASNLPVPDSMPPTFHGDHYHLEWTAHLWVGIPGAYPDVRETAVVPVAPLRLGPPMPATDITYSLPALGGLGAEVDLRCPEGPNGLAIVPIGQEVPYTVRLTPEFEAPGDRITVELAYIITGMSTTERRAVARATLFPHGWVPGETIEADGVLRLPLTVPVTYVGRHMRVAWAMLITHEGTRGRRQQEAFEIMVLPGVSE